MTELQVLLTFLINLPTFRGQAQDCFRLARRLRVLLDHDDSLQTIELASSLLVFYDNVVVGLNQGVFPTVPIFSSYPRSVLPRFLYGLTSQVFDDDGLRRDNYSVQAVDMLQTALMLVRRCSVPENSKVAEAQGVSEFLEAQQAPSSPIDDYVADNITAMWSYVMDDPQTDVTLGFPGNGVTSDMRFPYVPKMCFVDPESVPRPIRSYMVRAVDKFLPSYFEVDSPCNLIQVYPYVEFPQRVCNLVTVPKSFKTTRAITITNTSSVIIGATLRETIWTALRRHGLKFVANVHDQSRSHEILKTEFDNVALFDLKGGSTCFSVEQQVRYLSHSRFAMSMFNYSRPSTVKYRNEAEVPVTTLTMGDSSCTALLTTNLVFFCLFAVARRYFILPGEVLSECMFRNLIKFTDDLGFFDRIAVVGDDVIVPAEIYQDFQEIAESQGVVINTRKSSIPTAVFKETCGSWFVKVPQSTKVHRLFPFRARTHSSDLIQNLSSMDALLSRSKKSSFLLASIIANSRFTHQLEYLNTEGYTNADIGSPIGINTKPRRVIPTAPKSIVVPDDVGLAFRLSESRATPRFTRRPVVDRGRIRQFSDLAYDKRVATDQSKGYTWPDAPSWVETHYPASSQRAIDERMRLQVHHCRVTGRFMA